MSGDAAGVRTGVRRGLDDRIGWACTDGIAALRLAPNAARRSVLTPDRLASLHATLDELARREDVALVVIFGGSREFCLGADVEVLGDSAAGEADGYLRMGESVMERLAAMPVPTVAAVKGPALGGGFELALGCDFCWAHSRSVFALPEARAGLIPAWGGVRALAARLPAASAWELLSGARVSARRAHALGLIGRVVEGGEFDTRIMSDARELAGLGKETLSALKSSWRAATGQGAELGASARDRRICLTLLEARAGSAVAGSGTHGVREAAS